MEVNTQVKIMVGSLMVETPISPVQGLILLDPLNDPISPFQSIVL